MYSIGEFSKLIEKISKIIILYKDKLLRFGFELINNLCRKFMKKELIKLRNL